MMHAAATTWAAVVGVMFLRTHFFRKSEASDMSTLLTNTIAEIAGRTKIESQD
jgi:hypothetical protein